MTDVHEQFMRRAIALAQNGIDANDGGPFGAVVVKDGRIVGEGCNQVTSTNDPTAHAEVVAIRNACRELKTFQLDDCIVYASCEPCPMCLGAIYWARPKQVFFACSRSDAKEAGFDDDLIYEELALPLESRRIPTATFLRDEGLRVFKNWVEKADKIEY
ncbi:MAG: nucleoside deaminase [Acidobacteria bacterium]|nr:nucleoside deaminase [Acidobacteriota bacterium]MBK8147044.1 nucleoside deaminase [Acidobacteriota bacterium]MBK8812400.1 nucleoside deaminase [Acidobacteriota bacterium]